MPVAVDVEESLAGKFAALFPHLDERQRRLMMGAEARMLGHGGVAAVARAAGVSRVTVTGGVRELEAGDEPLGRTRRTGGGRKSVTKTDPGVRAALLALVEPESRGDPGSPLRFPGRATRCQPRPWRACCGRRTSACRATPKRSRGATTRTATPSSPISTPRPKNT